MSQSESEFRVKAVAMRRCSLRRTLNRFRRACDQIVLLNRKMDCVLLRYHAARDLGNRSFRYKLRLRLAVVEGIRNMFYEYANRKAVEIVNLRRDLFGEIVEIVSDNGPSGISEEYDDYDSEEIYESEAEDSDDGEEDQEMEGDWSP